MKQPEKRQGQVELYQTGPAQCVLQPANSETDVFVFSQKSLKWDNGQKQSFWIVRWSRGFIAVKFASQSLQGRGCSTIHLLLRPLSAFAVSSPRWPLGSVTLAQACLCGPSWPVPAAALLRGKAVLGSRHRWRGVHGHGVPAQFSWWDLGFAWSFNLHA